MKRLNPPKATLAAVILTAAVCGLLVAQDQPRQVQLTTRDSAGTEIKVPQADRPSLLLFVRSDQDQSRTAVENAKGALKDLPAVGVMVILSGPQDAQLAGKFTQGLAWPVVQDPDFAMVGQLQVRVWPTSIVVMPDGKELARLRGLPQSYARDLNAYLSFATGKIDRQGLDHRLGAPEVVADSPEQMAGRHLQVANRLLEKGMVEQARQELDRGLKLHPADQRIELALARVYLMLDQPQQALAILDKYDQKSSLPGEVGTLKGWAMVSMKKWDQAITTLQGAIRLNPEPAEAYYFLGVSYQAKAQWPQAAGAFRSAFEATASGRLISAPNSPAGAASGPATPSNGR